MKPRKEEDHEILKVGRSAWWLTHSATRLGWDDRCIRDATHSRQPELHVLTLLKCVVDEVVGWVFDSAYTTRVQWKKEQGIVEAKEADY